MTLTCKEVAAYFERSVYLAPIPYRGKKNQPAYVPFVGTRIAEVKGLPVDQVARETFSATVRAFGLSKDGSQRDNIVP